MEVPQWEYYNGSTTVGVPHWWEYHSGITTLLQWDYHIATVGLPHWWEYDSGCTTLVGVPQWEYHNKSTTAEVLQYYCK
jgi:hypothetical protein